MLNEQTQPMTAEEYYDEWIKDRIILSLSPKDMVNFAGAYHNYRLGFEREQEPKLRPAVLWFAEQMQKKLILNDHKGGWKRCYHRYLFERLKQEVSELEQALDATDNQDEVIMEAADVANLAMMIADISGPLHGK